MSSSLSTCPCFNLAHIHAASCLPRTHPARRRQSLVKAAKRVWAAHAAATNAQLAAKLSRFPGTPAVALVRGCTAHRVLEPGQMAVPCPSWERRRHLRAHAERLRGVCATRLDRTHCAAQ